MEEGGGDGAARMTRFLIAGILGQNMGGEGVRRIDVGCQQAPYHSSSTVRA